MVCHCKLTVSLTHLIIAPRILKRESLRTIFYTVYFDPKEFVTETGRSLNGNTALGSCIKIQDFQDTEYQLQAGKILPATVLNC